MNVLWASLHIAFSVLVSGSSSCSLPASHQGACMLQTQAQSHAQRERTIAKHKVKQVDFPIEWLHVPKCGTSFIHTLLHFPGACPGIPENWTTEEMALIHPPGKYMGEDDLFCGNGIDIDRIKHPGVEIVPGWEAGKGRFMTMLRQPEQRALSMWYFQGESIEGGFDLMTHKKRNSGCVVKMLVRQNQRGCIGEPVSVEEIAEAKLRLKTGFAFVGLTDQWALSICLFNRMFGVPHCRPCQFTNTRPTAGHQSTVYNISELDGWRDDDNEIYELATEIFATSLLEYDVNDATCQRCWQEAGLRS